jgi:hypothetical protein
MNKFVLSVVVAVLVGGVIIAVLVFQPLRPRIDPGAQPRLAIAEICTRVLPEVQRVGIKSNFDRQGTFGIDIGGLREASGTDKAEIVDRVLTCVEKAYQEQKLTNSFVNKKPLPLGLIAQQWAHGEPTIYLERPQSESSEKILNNLWFGPVAGDKREVLASWCTSSSKCVRCEPSPKDDQFRTAVSIRVSLKENPLVRQEKMWGKWTNPSDLWELVDETGTRYLYHCGGES